ncbi:ribonuclease P [Mycobacterium paraense]|uniref:Ribonuclease P n=1 Tax=Mycobacterium paraense TaxID=767916 RepID=A0ABX3VQ20_9MYCO|nr:ribonuclease P [Mycobacterium paraense]ORW35224.1 ribonuclease P [Mycobacterium paraense]
MASLATASQPPRIKPYSVRASTAYWLQVGMKRHVAGRSGETM